MDEALSIERDWYIYGNEMHIMISYEDPDSLSSKAHVKDNYLGGIMIWELDYDNKAHTLLDTVFQKLQ